MKKRKSIFQLLIVMMMMSLFLPVGAVNAEIDMMGKKPPKEDPPTHQKGSLTIHKLAQEKGDKQKEGTGADGQSGVGEALDGVTYKLIQTHTFNPNTDTWTELGRHDTPVTFEETTGPDGKIHIGNIPLGRYSVQEIAAPSYVEMDTKKYYVDIPMTNPDGKTLNYNVHIYPKNELIKGAVELTKYDGEGKKNKGNYPPQSNVKFKLFKEDGTEVGTFETDNNGKIHVDGLEYGNYYFVETSARNGYLQHGGKFEFSITKYGEFTKGKHGNITGSKGKIEKVDVTNYYKPTIDKKINKKYTELEINRNTEFTYNLKVNLPADIDKYQSFVITDILHGDLTYGGSWNVDGVSNSAFTFSENGQELKWTVNNFNALKGKKEITINFTAKVKDKAKADKCIPNRGIINYKNETGTEGNDKSNEVCVKPTVGSITVIKTDDAKKDRDKKTLRGAEFDLIQDGKVIASGTTDRHGKIEFKDLDYGEYELVETKAPDGYRLKTKPIKVTVNKHNKHVEVKVENSKSDWELPKTGGIGTSLFTFIGLTFMGAALFMLIRRRRGNAS